MNGGFMVSTKAIFNYLALGELESQVFEELVRLKQICAYNHEGEWRSMNTLKDVIELNNLWENKNAFWKIWK